MASKCAGCNKTVYATEKVNILNKDWHKGCFKCSTCGMTLNARNFESSKGVPYCKSHVPSSVPTSMPTATPLASANNTPSRSSVAPAAAAPAQAPARQAGPSLAQSKPQLTPEQIAHVKREFELFDVDNSGSIEFDELKNLLETALHVRLSEKMFNKYVAVEFQKSDKNNDNKLVFDEFLELYTRLKFHPELPIHNSQEYIPGTGITKHAAPQQDPAEAAPVQRPAPIELTPEQKAAALEKFDQYDVDRSQTIDMTELKALLEDTIQSKMSAGMWNRFVKMNMSSVDKDGNNEIDFEEFLSLYAKLFVEHAEAQARPIF
eukprot:GEZU01030332.1.p1 GENE.GEZU01030332.1~~GEZU01030332.1.p1  ORF type:complete len:355 (-),score=113.50 GEZU01030332.1:45-1001(-)